MTVLAALTVIGWAVVVLDLAADLARSGHSPRRSRRVRRRT